LNPKRSLPNPDFTAHFEKSAFQIRTLSAERRCFGILFSFSGVERVSEEPDQTGFFVVPTLPVLRLLTG
jgi:hypothetical protein